MSLEVAPSEAQAIPFEACDSGGGQGGAACGRESLGGLTRRTGRSPSSAARNLDET